MKKLLAFVLAATMILALSACKDKENASSLSQSDASSVISAQGFVVPENYACIVNLAINPEFDLYLDADEDVIAINPLNDDAKSFSNEISLAESDVDDVIESIVKLAASKGFIKEKGHVISLNLSDIKNAKANATEILMDAAEAIDDAAKDLKMNIKAKTSITQSGANNESSLPTTSTAPNSSQTDKNDSHVCSFAAATCTKPATCACGKESGEALGHKWQAATCVSKKTCTVCKAKEGNYAPHNYVDGFCKVCKQYEPMDPKKYLKMNVEYIGNFRISNGELIASALMFDGEVCVLTDRTFTKTPNDPDQQPIIFKGNKYYSEGGGMEPYGYSINDKKIEVTQSLYNESPDGVNIGIHVFKDGRLKVISSRFVQFPTGSLYSTDINQVLN